jgi:hypothetical protein
MPRPTEMAKPNIHHLIISAFRKVPSGRYVRFDMRLPKGYEEVNED